MRAAREEQTAGKSTVELEEMVRRAQEDVSSKKVKNIYADDDKL